MGAPLRASLNIVSHGAGREASVRHKRPQCVRFDVGVPRGETGTLAKSSYSVERAALIRWRYVASPGLGQPCMRASSRPAGIFPRRKAHRKAHRKARDVASDERSAQPVCQGTRDCERYSVSEVIIREGDSFEVALKKFSRRVQQEGLLSEARRHQHYEPPSVKRKRKAEARERKARKARLKAAAKGY